MSERKAYVGRMKPLLLLFLTLLAPPALASGDHDDAREAVQAHNLLPLAEIIAGVLETFDARMLEVELERDGGGYLYEFELITASGQMLEVAVDAMTGDIVEVEQEGWKGGRD